MKNTQSTLLEDILRYDFSSQKVGKVIRATLIIVWFITIGLLYFSFDKLREVKRISEAETDPRLVASGKKGTYYLLTGNLGGGLLSGEDKVEEEASQLGLIIYAVQEWTLSRSSTDWSGVGDQESEGWRTNRIVLPEEITLDGIVITIQPATNVELDYNQPFGVVISGSEGEFRNIQEGSILVIGFRSGTRVTLLGKRGATAVLVVNHVYDEDREAIIAEFKDKADTVTLIGGVSLVVSLGLTGIYLWFRNKRT